MTSIWVSLEGVNGVGKTLLARTLAERLPGRARVLSELTDGGGDAMTTAVVTALSSGQSFLRTGHPLTETMALLALKVREHEHVTALTDPPETVIEDRGVDTVAVYQAAIGTPDQITDQALKRAADRVYSAAAPWRPLPDLTILLLDDPTDCERRLARREGRPVALDEHRIIIRADRLYRWRARVEPDRIRTIDRTGLHFDDVLDAATELVQSAMLAATTGGGAR